MTHYDEMQEATNDCDRSLRKAKRKALDDVAYRGRHVTDEEVVERLANLQDHGKLLTTRDAYTLASARAVIERLTKQEVDLIDTVEACLVAAGAPEDIDEMEYHVCAAGTKPSHYVKQQIQRLTKELQQRDVFLDQRIEYLSFLRERSLQGSFHEEDLREQRDELLIIKLENKRIQEHLKKA